jgi:hypothetical protein
MQLKPVAVMSQNELEFFEDGGSAIVIPMSAALADDGGLMLYALPATHRIVSVEVLERVHQFAALAAEHYSGMNDEVCQSYSEPWQQGVALGKELKAIIDKEPT